jgi:hypothetical protein
MSKAERDEEREHRILNEAIVDAHGPEEQAIGWFYYLEDKIQIPFDARCIIELSISPLHMGEVVKVIGMADEYDCMVEMIVEIEWENRNFGVPLSQLEDIEMNDETKEAIEDWHYWVGKGCLLCG